MLAPANAPVILSTADLPENITRATNKAENAQRQRAIADARRLGGADAEGAGLGLSSFSKQVTCVTPDTAETKRLRRMAAVTTEAAHSFTEHPYLRKWKPAMVTLTYRDDAEWHSRQITALNKHVREWLRRQGWPMHGIWVLESTKRGRPHYHGLIWLPPGVKLPKPDEAGWWPHGMTRIEWAKKPIEYLAKYTSKAQSKGANIPKGARLYGVLGAMKNLSWWRAPAWLRDIAKPGMRITRIKGGWWGVWELAHAWRSPWRFMDITPWGIIITWVGWSQGDVRPLWELQL